MPVADKLTKMLLEVKGFDRICQPIKILAAGNGSIKAEVEVTSDHLNPMGGLHGGYIATLVDIVSTLGLLSQERGLAPAVSVNMNVNYLSGAKEGDTVEISGSTLKLGKSLIFLHVEIKNKETGVLLVKGSHTKCFLPEKSKTGWMIDPNNF